jgi:hypothetical protein
MVKNLYGCFTIQNGLEQRIASAPLLFTLALKYIIWKVQENQMGMKLNGSSASVLC